MATVNINVSVTDPPKSSQPLKSDTVISMDETTLTAGEHQLLMSKDDLKAITAPGKTISTIAQAINLVTVTPAPPHGQTDGSTVPVVISGVAPTAYNRSAETTVISATEFTYLLSSGPGVATTIGVVKTVVAGKITQMNITY